METLPHTPILYFFILVLGIVIVIVEYNAEDNPQVQANQDNIKFLLTNDKTQTQSIVNLQEAVVKQSIRSADNTDRIMELEEYDETITDVIGIINSDIRNKFPQSQGLPPEGQSTQSPIPTLTLKMDESEFVLGNTIIFYGMAKPNSPIFLTIKDPSRGLWQIPISTNAIIDGAYMANHTLRLDDPIGPWSVYARQGSDTTRPITFTVE